ncbi:hypothetical protein [Peribacillus sp. NPDC096540]
MWLTPIFFLLGAAVIENHLLKEESRVHEYPTVETKLVIEQLTYNPH